MPYPFAPYPTVRLRPGRSRRFAAAAAAGVLAALLAGCTSQGQNTSAVSAAPAAVAAGAATSASAAAPRPAAAAPKAAADGKTQPDIGAEVAAADRQVIRTANLTLDVEVTSADTTPADDQKALQRKVDEATENVRNLATGAGYVSAAQGKGTTQSVTLRVPAAGYDNVMAALGRIAPVLNRQESTEDVTSKLVDITSRMQTMTASVNRVRALLSKADKIGDVIAIESELSAREADLESLQRQQAALAGQTALSTITVVVQGSIIGVQQKVASVAPAARSGFLGGLANGWAAVRHVGHAGLTVLGTLLPFVPVVAVLVLIGLYIRRRIHPAVPPALPPVRDPQPVD